MIFIVVKWKPKPEHVEDFPQIVAEFTEATRNEPGNLWFEWSRSLDDPGEYVLVEAFADGAAEAHVGSDHFKKATSELGQYLASTPQIVSQQLEGKTDWDEMGEIQAQ